MPKKLTNNNPLTLPIRLYPLKRHFRLFIIVLGLMAVLLGYLIIFPMSPDVSIRGEIPVLLQRILFTATLVGLLWAMCMFYRILRSPHPMIILNADKMTVNNFYNRKTDDYYWQDIKEITFEYGQVSRIGLYFKDQPPLSKPKYVKWQMNYVLDDGVYRQTINNRELADIINQLHIANKRASKHLSSSVSSETLFEGIPASAPLVSFHEVKRKFRDAL